MSFWAFIGWTIWIFFFVAYLIVLFQILTDLFRDKGTNGWIKAIWVVLLVFLPFITALVYLIARGRGMAERRAEELQELHQAQVAYAKQLMAEAGTTQAGANHTDQLKAAKELLDAGAISQEEFDQLKAKVLSA